MKYPNNLQQLRKGAGLSQSQFAEKTKLNKRTVEHYEQGNRNLGGAKIPTLATICNALNCTLLELLGENGKDVVSAIKKMKLD